VALLYYITTTERYWNAETPCRGGCHPPEGEDFAVARVLYCGNDEIAQKRSRTRAAAARPSDPVGREYSAARRRDRSPPHPGRYLSGAQSSRVVSHLRITSGVRRRATTATTGTSHAIALGSATARAKRSSATAANRFGHRPKPGRRSCCSLRKHGHRSKPFSTSWALDCVSSPVRRRNQQPPRVDARPHRRRSSRRPRTRFHIIIPTDVGLVHDDVIEGPPAVSRARAPEGNGGE